MGKKTVNITVVTTQYRLEALKDWSAYQQKILSIVEQSKKRKANLLLLPEYAGLELAWFYKADLHHQWEKLQQHLEEYLAFFSRIAKEHELYIQPGTIPVKLPSGDFRNRAYFFNPRGEYDYQDKIIITPSEDALDVFSSGEKLTVFETVFGKIGIAICYDSEFPALVHELAYKQKAQIILVPSYTDTLHGFYRVHLACRARALEYQCYVVQACARSKVNVCEFLDTTAVGQAGIFSPPDEGFPENGILALGDESKDNEWISASLLLEKLEQVRQNGQVHNFSDLEFWEKIHKNMTIEKKHF